MLINRKYEKKFLLLMWWRVICAIMNYIIYIYIFALSFFPLFFCCCYCFLFFRFFYSYKKSANVIWYNIFTHFFLFFAFCGTYMPAFGDILLRAHGTNYVHTAIYIGTPREFSSFMTELPPSERDAILQSLREEESYVIHFAGSNDAQDASQNWLSALRLSLSSQRNGESTGGPSITTDLFEAEFPDFTQHLVSTQAMHTPRSDWNHESVQYAILEPSTTEPIIYTPEETVSRAFSMYGYRFGTYHLLDNNCQHFVTYCKYGRRFMLSTQVKFLSWKAVEIAGAAINFLRSAANNTNWRSA